MASLMVNEFKVNTNPSSWLLSEVLPVIMVFLHWDSIGCIGRTQQASAAEYDIEIK